ncbi:hypothetical protein [Klebsiella pneumoniae]
MSNFKPNKEHLRHVMIFLFNQKKKASECHRIRSSSFPLSNESGSPYFS